MKENKLLGKEASSEDERSRVEIIQEDVKNATFGVFYLLLKNQETTYWKFIVLFIIEYLQLLSFAFDESLVSQWKSVVVVQYISQILQSFRVVYWLQRLSWDVYLILFYILIFLLFLVIIDFLYVAISFKHKKFSFMQPIQILRFAAILITSILYVPITEFYFSLSACLTDPSKNQVMHRVYREEKCFDGIHILHITISYLGLLIFVGISVMITVLHYENRYTKDPTAKINAKADLLQLLSKTVYCFVFTFFFPDAYAVFKNLVLAVFSTLTFYAYVKIKPYFNSSTQTLAEIFAGIFCWTTYVLLFSQAIRSLMYNGALVIYLLGIPIVSILIYTKSEDRLYLLMHSEAQLAKGEDCQKKNFFYLHIIETKEVDRYSAIVLKGYINHHSEVCPYDSCPIKAFKRMVAREKLTGETDRKRRQSGNKTNTNSLENNSLLLSQAKALYNNGIKRFPKCTALRIDYANFLQSRMKDRKGALNELSQAEKFKPDIDHQFMVFRQRKIIEDELTEGQEHGGVDFIAALNFENQFKAFKHYIERSALLHYEFWNHLLDDSPDLVRLSQQGAKINSSILNVEENWKKLSKMNTNTPKALKLYASYLIEVLNDKEMGNEQMLKAKEAANLRVNFEFNNANEDYSDLNNYAQDGTPCVYISGEQERLGIINQCNMSMCKVFGYIKKEDVINKDVEILMPETYSINHKDFLSVSNQKSSDQISSRERQVFGKHFSGFIFPLWLQIKNLPSLLSGKQYAATFKVEKTGINKNVAHLLLNKNKEVLDISPSCMQMLGISFEKLQKKTIFYDVPSLLPHLFLSSQQTYQNKAGAQITYYYPQLQEIESLKKDQTELGADENREAREGAIDEISERNSQEEEDIDTSQAPSYSPQKQSTKFFKKTTQGGSSELNENKEDENENNYQQYQYKAVGNPNRVLYFQCNLTEIYFELIGLSGGYYLRLESISDKSASFTVPKKIRYHAFQFTYDPIYKRFVRELRDSDNKEYQIDKNYLALKHLKDQNKTLENADEEEKQNKFQGLSYMNFLNKQQRQIEKGIDILDVDEEEDNQSEDSSIASNDKSKKETETQKVEKTVTPTPIPSSNQQDFMKQLVAGEGYGKEFYKSEIERLIRLLHEKQLAGQDVHTFQRNEGQRKGWEEVQNQHASLFANRSSEIPKIEEDEEDEESQDGEKEKDGDQLKANIKSKKAFSMAINDKTMPPAIKRLSRTAQVILLVLIALATAEYSTIYQELNNTRTNFQLIEMSYLRTAELQKVTYNARTMVLLNQGLLTDFHGYSSREELVEAVKADFSSSLDSVYSIQNEINLSQLPLSDEHNSLLNYKEVNLYFKEDNSNMKALQFSLIESILQISSTIFTVSNMEVEEFNEDNEDVFFLLYNSFNDFYQALTRSSTLYVQELEDRSEQKSEISLVLFILSVITLAVAILILIPVVSSVNSQKDRVLALFCEIDNSAIRVLSLRCERFMNNMVAEEGNDDIDSNEDIENNIQNDDDDEYNLLSGTGRKQKKAKGRTRTDNKFFLKFIIALLFIMAYYLQTYLTYQNDIKTAQVLTSELNVTSITEPFCWFALNTQRELYLDPSRPVRNEDSFTVAKRSINQLYNQIDKMQQVRVFDLTHELIDASVTAVVRQQRLLGTF